MRLRRFLSKGGWNLIGTDTNFSLADVTFTNDSGNSYTWANALANNKVQAYLSYYDNSPATASERKYKYASTVSGMDDTSLRKNRGYWIYMNNSGNLTLPSAGGSLSGETYNWDKLRFWNGSNEKSISDVGVFGDNWIDSDLRYWEDNAFKIASDVGSTTTLNSWTGYFIYSNSDNMTLIRQN